MTANLTSLDKFDIRTNFLPTGEPRCDLTYRAMDGPEDCGTVEWARCTDPATLRVRITPAETSVARDGSMKVTYTPQPDKAHEADSCERCYEYGRRDMGTEGHPAKVEFVRRIQELVQEGTQCTQA